VKLDVIVATYNRCQLLERTLLSLLAAPIPDDLDLTLRIVDNNSTDRTAQIVALYQSQTPRRLLYQSETKQGLSNTRNAGIAAGTGDLIGFLDDDEEIDPAWFQVVAREFKDPSIQFIGGPYLPNYQAPQPPWLPTGYNSVIGVVRPKPRMPYGPGFPGNLNGGNAVFRRSVFDQVGRFNPNLGRSGKGLLSEEDGELYRRILAAGIHGIHAPDLVIYHHIPASRLTRKYYRSWCYWRGVSHGIADRDQKEPVPYLLGLPRYRVRAALSGLFFLPANLSEHQGSPHAFTRELPLWDALGFLRGKFFTNIASLYAPQR
jgi:glycosyltransferase involved in cell wall biosynthesis